MIRKGLAMIRKLVTIGAVGVTLAVSACRDEPKRNPDDRVAEAGIENPVP